MVHRREDLVASALYLNALIDRAYAAEHRRQPQLRPGFVASISETGKKKKKKRLGIICRKIYSCMFTYGDTVAVSQRCCDRFMSGKKKK